MTWTAIALSRDVLPETTRAVRLDGREIVVWRGADGEAHVWEDRCPHRGMRLSFGFVRGDALNCLYHGWTYGSDASCRKIPAHPDLTVPPTIKANAFACREQGGMIWTSLEVAGDEPPALPESAVAVASVAIWATVEVPAAAKVEGGRLYLQSHSPQPGTTIVHAVADGAAAASPGLRWLWNFRAEAEGTTP